MAQQSRLRGRAKQAVQHATQTAEPWVERWGRCGYAAHGIVYGLVGVLAAAAAVGSGGATTDAQGVLERVITAPFGQLLLGLVAIGLVGYAAWQFIQAGLDTERKGTEAKGLVARVGYAITGVVHLGLALFAVRLLGGASSAGENSDQAAQDWTARLLSQPFGQALVGVVGLIVIGVGLRQLYLAYSTDFQQDLNFSSMSADQQRWVIRAGRAGFAARGIVFGVIGGFLIMAAIQAEPGQARGLGGALATLTTSPAGPWLLGLVAVGLVAYGLFTLVASRYRLMVRA